MQYIWARIHFLLVLLRKSMGHWHTAYKCQSDAVLSGKVRRCCLCLCHFDSFQVEWINQVNRYEEVRQTQAHKIKTTERRRIIKRLRHNFDVDVIGRGCTICTYVLIDICGPLSAEWKWSVCIATGKSAAVASIDGVCMCVRVPCGLTIHISEVMWYHAFAIVFFDNGRQKKKMEQNCSLTFNLNCLFDGIRYHLFYVIAHDNYSHGHKHLSTLITMEEQRPNFHIFLLNTRVRCVSRLIINAWFIGGRDGLFDN